MLQGAVSSAPAQKKTLSDDARACVIAGAKVASQAGSEVISLEHLLIGLLDPPDAHLKPVLSAIGVDVSNLLSSLKARQPGPVNAKISVRTFDDETRDALRHAGREAARLNVPNVDSRHVLLGMLANPSSSVAMTLGATGLTRDVVLNQLQGYTQPQGAASAPATLRGVVHVSTLFLVLLEVFVLTGVGLAIVSNAAAARALLVTFIVTGWVISLCMHEFGHAAAAYLGGDTGIVQRGTLTIDPRKYTHPLLSIVLPLVFLALGGIALPGGAVRVDQSRLRSKTWNLIVALAGPAGTVVSLLILGIPFLLFGSRFVDSQTFYLWAGMSGLAQILVFVLILNLLPVPPLDGFRIVSAWLPLPVQQQFFRLGWLPVLFLYALLASPNTLSLGVWHATDGILHLLRISGDLGAYALSLMQL